MKLAEARIVMKRRFRRPAFEEQVDTPKPGRVDNPVRVRLNQVVSAPLPSVGVEQSVKVKVLIEPRSTCRFCA